MQIGSSQAQRPASAASTRQASPARQPDPASKTRDSVRLSGETGAKGSARAMVRGLSDNFGQSEPAGGPKASARASGKPAKTPPEVDRAPSEGQPPKARASARGERISHQPTPPTAGPPSGGEKTGSGGSSTDGPEPQPPAYTPPPTYHPSHPVVGGAISIPPSWINY